MHDLPILVIDGEADIRNLLKARLERLGYQVQAVPDGESGLAAARELSFRAVVLEVLLPDMDGQEVVGQLRRTPSTSGVPIIVVSIVEDLDPDLYRKISGHLVKPVRGRDLDALVQRVVGLP